MLTEKIRENIGKYMLCSALTMLTGFWALVGYSRIWEYKQPKEEMRYAIVREIRPYYYMNELHWSFGGFGGNRIFIRGEEKPIDFPYKYWDDSVSEGDMVNLIVRKNFPLFSDKLDGLYINDHE